MRAWIINIAVCIEMRRIRLNQYELFQKQNTDSILRVPGRNYPVGYYLRY